MTEQTTAEEILAQAAEIDGAAFAQLVSSASADQLREVMAHAEIRELILVRVFEQMEQRLRPQKARGMHEVIHWKIDGRADGGQDAFQITINDGVASASRTLDAKPRVTFEMDSLAFLQLISGHTSGMKLMLSRKLKVRGDMMFAPRVEGLFETDPTAL